MSMCVTLGLKLRHNITEKQSLASDKSSLLFYCSVFYLFYILDYCTDNQHSALQ